MSAIVSVNLRLSSELHRLLKDLAQAEHRSLNSEIIALLEEALWLRGKGTERNDQATQVSEVNKTPPHHEEQQPWN